MSASTSVTARMCVQCLEDCIKVVIDRRHNKNADTGMFEMIYRQNAGSVAVQQFSGHDLTIIGKKLTRDIDWPMTMSKSMANVVSRHNNKSQPALGYTPHNSIQNTNTASQSQSITSSPSSGNKQTLSELLQKLRVRNQEMFQGALASQQAKTDSAFIEATKNPRMIAGASGVNPTSEPNVGTDRNRNNRNPDTSLFEMIYKQNTTSGGIQHLSGPDLAIIGKKLTGDVDWPITAVKGPANYSKNPKETSQPATSQSTNNNTGSNATNNPVDNKATLSELLQKLRVRNQEVFQGNLGMS